MISFHLACFGTGVPSYDILGTDSIKLGDERTTALPKVLLGRCGMLAFAGHLGRTLDSSFRLDPDHYDIRAFKYMVQLLAMKTPIGYAMQGLRERGAHYALQMQSLERRLRAKEDISDISICNTWAKSLDANSYLLLGDPAVTIRTTSEGG